MAQILKYWNCRVFPDDDLTYTADSINQSLSVNYYDQNYNWQNMNLNRPDNDNALFLYHCAIALQSEFCYKGLSTSSSIYNARIAFRKYFGFNANFPISKSNYTDNVWINLLKMEIDKKRPIFYVGYDYNTQSKSGHGWVIDGYKNDNTFHCNWGWKGSDNGWFLLSNLTPDGQSYNDHQAAILNIYPYLDACSGLSGQGAICSSNTSYSVTIPSSASVTWSKSSNLTQTGGSTGTTYTVHATNSSQNSTGFVKATIKNSQGDVFLIRNKNIWIGKPNFTLKGDYELDTRLMGLAEIHYTGGSQQGITNLVWGRSDAITRIAGGSVIAKYWAGSRPGSGTVDLTLTNQCGSMFKYFIVRVTGGWHKTYPNPVNNILTIEIDKSKISDKSIINTIEVRLYDKLMTLKKYGKTKGSIITIDVNDLKPDVYILQIKNGDEIFEEKIVVSEK